MVRDPGCIAGIGMTVGGRIFGWRAPEEEEGYAPASAQALSGLAAAPDTLSPQTRPAARAPGGAMSYQRMLEQALDDERTDNRRRRRSRVLLHGKIVFDGGKASSDCVIRDLSEHGAKVRLPHEMAVPHQLYLIETRRGAAYVARLTWSRGAELGLEFHGSHDLQAPDTPILTIMRQIWLEHLAR
jgi:two-component system cell cycle response regulator